MRKIRTAQIGIGHDHASGIFTTLKEMTDEVELVGTCVPDDDDRSNEQKRAHVYEQYPRLSLEKILSDESIEAVTVETVDHLLTKYAKLALDAGKAVHMDKPGGICADEFDAMADTALQKNLPLSLGYMYRFNPAIMELLKRIENGDLGEILYVNAEMSCYHKPEKRKWLSQYPGGMMNFLGCHLVDLIFMLQGEPLETIPLHAESGLDGVISEDVSFTAFRYPHGVSFARSTAVERGGVARRNLLVVGTKGSFELKPTEYRAFDDPAISGDILKSDYRYTFDPAWRASGETETTEPFHRYRDMMEAFCGYVRGEKENRFTPDYEKKLHRLLLRACGVKL